jgi:thiol-disulfide isomerase/thioredoxin
MRYLLLVISLLPCLLLAEPEKKKITNAWELSPLILPDLAGNTHNLYEWQGKVIILNFWATWCGPCQIEIPHLIRYQNLYAAKGLQIIGVGLDEVQKMRNFVRTVGINYPILQADPEDYYPLLSKWGNPFGTLPYTVVLDRQGKFVLMQQGVFSDESFNKLVLPLLQK